MCWNAEVSLQSFGIGIVAVLVAYMKGLSLSMTIFFMTVVFMQLIEYIVWSNYDNPDINYMASISAFLLLWMQPLAAILTLPSSWLPSVIGCYIGLTFLMSFMTEKMSREKYRMYRGENGHLVWNWIQKDRETFLYGIGYLAFLYFPLVISQNWELLTLTLGTFFFSLYNFWRFHTWGSMWCWIGNYVVTGFAIRQVLVSKP